MSRPCIAVLVTLALQGCSSRMHGAQHDIPARPVLGAAIERAARPLTGNALIGLLGPDDVADRRKEDYNRAGPSAWPQFSPDIQHGLALYDGFDGTCGNQWLADDRAEPVARYRALADLLADDRLWIDSKATVCTQYLAVERATPGDCGGRPPSYDVDVFRSLLVLGARSGVDDGIDRDDRVHSASEFPFLAAP
jgi:hypothetical protein